MSSWIAYNTGLPNVSVRDLEIFYPLGKLKAATYGRGVWEADLYNNGTLAPIANFGSDKTVICAGMTVNFTDLSTFSPTTWSWTFQNGSPATSTSQNPSVQYTIPGTYSVSLTASNTNGANTMTKTLYITVSPVNLLPLVEGFQAATFPPTNWQNVDVNSDNKKWARNATVGRASTASMYYDNYNLDASGSRDEMRTPKFDFSAYNRARLFFDVAYSQYNNTYSDSLAIMVSTDCGLTFSQVYLKGGTTLATAPNDTVAIFNPTTSQWRTDTVSLNSFTGQANVMISFQNRGHYGQAIYVDNVNISGANTNQPPVAAFSINTALCAGQNITFSDQSSNIPNAWNWSFPGANPDTSNASNPIVSYSVSGTYTISLTAINGAGSSSPLTQTIQVNAVPTLTATVSSLTVCSGQSDVLSASGATTYTWLPGNHAGSTYTVNPTANMIYTVSGTNAGCSNTANVSVAIKALPVISITAVPDTICQGNSTTLHASGASTYSWSASQGLTTTTGTSVSVNPTVTTVFTVIGTDTLSKCANKGTLSVLVKSCIGIAENRLVGNVLIYPNPSNGIFDLDFQPGYAESYVMKVYNTYGQLVYSDKMEVSVSGGKKTVDLSNFSKGVYTISLQSKERKMMVKLITQ